MLFNRKISLLNGWLNGCANKASEGIGEDISPIPRLANRSDADAAAARPSLTRRHMIEQMEPRCLMTASPIQVGAVYIEEDVGSDLHGDTFIITFQGGAAGTQLTRLTIDGDMDGDGFSRGDVFFDTVYGGLGADLAYPFTIVSLDTANPNASVRATVEDGSTRLVLEFTDFVAGDRLVFEIDVDEALRFDPNETNLDIINESFDPITSGVEFQGTLFQAEFSAPHYEVAAGESRFLNRYDAFLLRTGLPLPLDDADGRRDRTAGSGIELQQVPKPVSLSGIVYVDSNEDLRLQAGETQLSGVRVELFKLETGRYVSTGHTASTDANGRYTFGTELGLQPGTYQVRQTQPAGYYSVGASVGLLDGSPVGQLVSGNPDILTEIHLPKGDQHATELNFAENLPASISGNVCYVVTGFDCFSESSVKAPLENVELQLRNATGTLLATTFTNADGTYRFDNLRAGVYSITQVTPAGLLEGSARVGSNGGTIVNGSMITQIVIGGGNAAVNYDFCELSPSELSGYSYYDQNESGRRDAGETPIANVQITLWDAQGNQVAQTRTNAQGFYRFTNLRPGTYRVTQTQPTDYLPGRASAGTISGQAVGATDASGNVITQIVIPAGVAGVNYDFGELLPGSIAGQVIADTNGNCIIDAVGDRPLPGVTIELLNATGGVIATTLTDAQGRYRFDGLTPGQYSVRQIQPAGYFQGTQRVGSGGGDASIDDLIRAIQVGSGVELVDYNFCEIPPSTLSGRVYVDTDMDCYFDPGEEPLAGVRITLYDASGNELGSTLTNANGEYRFEGLRPGEYTVRQTQPAGYLQGGQRAGSAGGNDTVDDVISEINVTPGSNLIEYDFCEIPPATLAGRVYVDSDMDCQFDPGEAPLAGVRITLYDADGNMLGSTTTNASGDYRFEGLRPGVYTVRQTQPAGYLQGGQRAGSAGGDDSVQDEISQINVAPGADLIEYDFCEIMPGSISGRVFVDSDQDLYFDADEQPIAGVTVTLLDANNQVVATTQTDQQGNYLFSNLAPGRYTVRQLQPLGYFQGGQRAGSGGGDASREDVISDIDLTPGGQFIEYDFAELLPGSISGRVFADIDFDCILDDFETTLSGVRIDLLDAQGSLIASTLTDENGEYTFANLRPGSYAVREHQPVGYFQGQSIAPATGGDTSVQDVISSIIVGSEQAIREANFCEIPPAEISGYVFQDGPELATADGNVPDNLQDFRDGIRTADDTPIAGVTLRLLRTNGEAVLASAALPGFYTGEFVEVVTDANGYYHFAGLRGGTFYHVFQVQPEGFWDGLDTVGTTGGQTLNTQAEVEAFFNFGTNAALRQFSDTQLMDAVLWVSLEPGQTSAENNFSEVLVRRETPVPPIPPQVNEFNRPPVTPEVFTGPAPIRWQPLLWEPLPLVASAGYTDSPTWHLSVINGGFPRGIRNGEALADEEVEKNAEQINLAAWTIQGLHESTWLVSTHPDSQIATTARNAFDIEGAQPLAGDFNGDGFDELALFIDGEWFIDVNGNGRWDDGDIWLRLGEKGDQPVVGDWDGDGKDDVGVFGRKWAGDDRAIANEMGIPDAENFQRKQAKNLPPRADQAPDDPRMLKKSRNGQPRADLIDHVFRFGNGKDIAVSGDFNGDGHATVGVYRNGRWSLDANGDGRLTTDGQDLYYDFGGAEGDIPLVGDFDGDGVDEIAIVRGNQVIVDSNRNGRIDATDQVFQLDSTDGTIIVGDFDGDGRDEPAVHQRGLKRTLQAQR